MFDNYLWAIGTAWATIVFTYYHGHINRSEMKIIWKPFENYYVDSCLKSNMYPEMFWKVEQYVNRL